MTDVINQYARFDLPSNWAAGGRRSLTGTHVKLRENNLPASRHIRAWRIRRHRLSSHLRYIYRALHQLHPPAACGRRFTFSTLS